MMYETLQQRFQKEWDQIVKNADGKCQTPWCGKTNQKLVMRPLGPLWAICPVCIQEFELGMKESLETLKHLYSDD